MATTLTVSLFRHNEVAIGHVGDSRAYLVRQGQIRQLTSDHTYVAMQMKMSLISKEEAMSSDLRTMLTRSIGQNPTVQVDYDRALLRDHDTIIQCSDGLHACLTDHELRDTVNRLPPRSVRSTGPPRPEARIAGQYFRAGRADRKRSEGRALSRLGGTAPAPARRSLRSSAGQLLDERFQITGVINRSAMSSVFKATDLKTGQPVA
jgi:hypothetical protein